MCCGTVLSPLFHKGCSSVYSAKAGNKEDSEASFLNILRVQTALIMATSGSLNRPKQNSLFDHTHHFLVMGPATAAKVLHTAYSFSAFA